MDHKIRRTLLLAASLSLLTNCKSTVTEKPSQNPATVQQKENQRAARLNTSPQWAAFKTFWQKLDAIEPTHKERNYVDSANRDYQGALSHELGEKFTKELEQYNTALLNEIESGLIPLDTLELSLLYTLCQQRIQYMQMGRPSMYTRMMIDYESLMIAQENSYVKLENRIDLLLRLKEKGSVSDKEFQLALIQIQKSVEEFAILETISTNYGFTRLGRFPSLIPDSLQSIPAKHIYDFEEHYKQYKERVKTEQQKQGKKGTSIFKDIDARYNKTKEKLSQVQKIIPSLNELIANLEQ